MGGRLRSASSLFLAQAKQTSTPKLYLRTVSNPWFCQKMRPEWKWFPYPDFLSFIFFLNWVKLWFFSLLTRELRRRKSHTRELKQTRRRRKRERHLKMWLLFSAIIFQLFKLTMLEKCVLTILELNWNQRLGRKKTKLSICVHMLTSSTQQQNRSFHDVERTRTSSKCQKVKYARAKRAKLLFFIVKYANLWGCCDRRRRGCSLIPIVGTRS